MSFGQQIFLEMSVKRDYDGKHLFSIFKDL